MYFFTIFHSMKASVIWQDKYNTTKNIFKMQILLKEHLLRSTLKKDNNRQQHTFFYLNVHGAKGFYIFKLSADASHK